MKNSIFLLIMLLFIACENKDLEESQAQATSVEADSEPIEKRSEVIEKFYENIPDKEFFELNEDFHVMALSGLRMRKTPELKGETLLTIPYNAAVKRVDNGDYGDLEVEEIKDFKIKGNWVKVKYDGKVGYVFDGFLTKFPLPKRLKNGAFDYEKYSSSFDFYLKTKIGSASEIYDVKKYEDCEVTENWDCVCYYKQNFGKNIAFSRDVCNEVGAEYFITFRDVSLAEVYFIIKAMDLNGENASVPGAEQFETITYNKAEKSIAIEVDGAGCYTMIKKEADDSVSVEIYCGC